MSRTRRPAHGSERRGPDKVWSTGPHFLIDGVQHRGDSGPLSLTVSPALRSMSTRHDAFFLAFAGQMPSSHKRRHRNASSFSGALTFQPVPFLTDIKTTTRPRALTGSICNQRAKWRPLSLRAAACGVKVSQLSVSATTHYRSQKAYVFGIISGDAISGLPPGFS